MPVLPPLVVFLAFIVPGLLQRPGAASRSGWDWAFDAAVVACLAFTLLTFAGPGIVPTDPVEAARQAMSTVHRNLTLSLIGAGSGCVAFGIFLVRLRRRDA